MKKRTKWWWGGLCKSEFIPSVSGRMPTRMHSRSVLIMCAYVVEESRVVLLNMDAGWKPDRSLARVDSSSIHVMLEARNVPALRDVRSSKAPRLCSLPTPFSLYIFFFFLQLKEPCRIRGIDDIPSIQALSANTQNPNSIPFYTFRRRIARCTAVWNWKIFFSLGINTCHLSSTDGNLLLLMPF